MTFVNQLQKEKQNMYFSAISCMMFPKGLDITWLTANLKKIATVLTLNMFRQVSCYRQ